MKITLISTHKGELGIRSISSYTKYHGMENITLIFAPLFEDSLYNRQQIEAIIEKCKCTDLIGISSAAISNKRTIQFLKEMRKNPAVSSKFIVVGGITSTLTPEYYLQLGADGSNIYEGEVSFTELAGKLKNDADIYSVKNFWFKSGGQIIKNPVRKPILNIDELPFPDYDFLNNGHYEITHEGLKKITTQEQAFGDVPNLASAGQGNLFVFTIRGCPYNCNYCCNYHLMNINQSLKSPIIRKQSINKVVSDLEMITKKNPYIKYISFFDDDFFIRDLDEIKKFSTKYREKVRLPFFVNATPRTFSEEKLKLLLDSGMNRLCIGFQTGSKRMLKIYNRPVDNVDDAEKITKITSKYSIKMSIPDFDFLINSPFETEKDILENLNFIKKLHGPFDAQMHNLHLFPGSKLYAKAIENGISPYENLGQELQDHRHYIEGMASGIKDGRNFYTLILYLMTGEHVGNKLGAITRDELTWLLSVAKEQREELIDWFKTKFEELNIIKYYQRQEIVYKK